MSKKIFLLLLITGFAFSVQAQKNALTKMMFGDTSRTGTPFSKDPHIFQDDNGKIYLFFQGNNDNGKTWYISNIEVFWDEKGPFLKK